MILSQLAPHRLVAQPTPRRSLRPPQEKGTGGAESDDGTAMKEVASLQASRGRCSTKHSQAR
jgi:hypothetical protein